MTHQDMTPQQRRRYNRHLILDGFGKEGQRRLLEAKVLIVGLGWVRQLHRISLRQAWGISVCSTVTSCRSTICKGK